jgi:hypothetical protein
MNDSHDLSELRRLCAQTEGMTPDQIPAELAMRIQQLSLRVKREGPLDSRPEPAEEGDEPWAKRR